MPFYRMLTVRGLMIATMCIIAIKSTSKVHAIADPATSSGAACYLECAYVGIECLEFHNPNGGTSYSGCYEAGNYCSEHCELYGSPFTSWWFF